MEYEVTIHFQYPAHDERDGISYVVQSLTKAGAIAEVRCLAKRDGHLPSNGRGRTRITAIAI